MSELKEYYNDGINKRQINISAKVMDDLEAGRRPNRKQHVMGWRKNLVLVLSIVSLIAVMGFTYLYELNFKLDDGSSWDMIFIQTDHKEERVQEIASDLALEPGDIATIYLNDGGVSDSVYTFESSIDIYNLQIINQELRNAFGLDLKSSYMGLDFMSGDIGSSMNEFVDIDKLKNLVPEGEYAYVVKREDQDIVFFCSDDEILAPKDLYVSEAEESNFTISGSVKYGARPEDGLWITFQNAIGNKAYSVNDADIEQVDKLLVNGDEIMVRRNEAPPGGFNSVSMSIIKDEIYVLLTKSGGIIDEDLMIDVLSEILSQIEDRTSEQ